MAQMAEVDSFWLCPHCGERASWSDDNYEEPYNTNYGMYDYTNNFT